ncbi:MAG: hypothetical protein JWO88_790 [Frankiales bacterium]|nr:hypothetical protein [Frankiales bacterium]
MKRAAAAGLLLLATACGGPQRPVDIGFKEVPSDVILGASPTPAPTPGRSATPGIAAPPPPSVIALPPPTFAFGPEPTPPPLPTEPTCATADPLQPPKREAPPSVSAPPQKASYIFHNVGSYAVSGADARTGTFPASSVRTVGNIIRPSTSNFSFDVSELLGDVTTTTTYDVVGASLVPAALPTGIYLKQVKSVRGTSTSTFSPSPELELAAFPLVRGASVSSSGVDPQTATSMQFTSTVKGKARVDACGAVLDTWVLDLTAGKLISPTQNLQFTSTYYLGTQYGGLMLRDRTAFAGTDGSDGVSRTNTANITMTPKVP